jgi:hypothetical protein
MSVVSFNGVGKQSYSESVDRVKVDAYKDSQAVIHCDPNNALFAIALTSLD